MKFGGLFSVLEGAKGVCEVPPGVDEASMLLAKQEKGPACVPSHGGCSTGETQGKQAGCGELAQGMGGELGLLGPFIQLLINIYSLNSCQVSHNFLGSGDEAMHDS